MLRVYFSITAQHSTAPQQEHVHSNTHARRACWQHHQGQLRHTGWPHAAVGVTGLLGPDGLGLCLLEEVLLKPVCGCAAEWPGDVHAPLRRAN